MCVCLSLFFIFIFARISLAWFLPWASIQVHMPVCQKWVTHKLFHISRHSAATLPIIISRKKGLPLWQAGHMWRVSLYFTLSAPRDSLPVGAARPSSRRHDEHSLLLLQCNPPSTVLHLLPTAMGSHFNQNLYPHLRYSTVIYMHAPLLPGKCFH